MTGKKMFDMILTGLSLLTTIAVIGLFYYTEKMYVKPPINEEEEKARLLKENHSKTMPVLFKVDKMTVSLSPNEAKLNQRMHWLEIEASFALFKEDDQGVMKAYLPIVQDRIISVTSKMGPDEINTVSGKVVLEERLKNEINKSLNKKIVRSIYFSKFVVQ